MARLLILLTATLVAFSAASGQSVGTKDHAAEVEVLFANGSLVRLTLVQETIDIDTLYGKLTVPLGDIRRIEFGMHVPAGMDTKVEAAIKKLASGEFKEREAAVRELTSLGAYAYVALLKASKSPEPEVSRRAADVVARIAAQVPAKELRLGEEDRVVTGKFTIVGKIVTPSIKARTEYFGDAQLTLPQLRQLRTLFAAKDAELSIDAAKYANLNEWLETNVRVDSTATLSIAATGQVDLCPQMPGTIVCGPQGYGPGGGPVMNAAGGFGGPAGGGPGGIGVAQAGGGKKKAVAMAAGRNHSGLLLGKIGENGDVFVIGTRFEGALEVEGKLYLHINPSQYDRSASGAYEVRISTKN